MRKRVSVVTLLVGFGVVCVLLLAGARPTWASPSASGPLVVNTLADFADATPGDGVCETATGNSVCTLRAAIMEANAEVGADTITFAITGTTFPSSQLPSITYSVAIAGPGPANLVLSGLHASLNFGLAGPNGYGVVYALSGIRITGNQTIGGLSINNGTLTIEDVSVDHTATGLFIYGYGANTRVTIANSLFADNVGPAGAGIYNLGGTLVLRDSTLRYNRANFFGGGLFNAGGTAYIYNTTFYSNVVTGSGPFGGFGGGVSNGSDSSLSVANSTFSDNRQLAIGSGGGGGGLHNDGLLTITSVTFSNNLTLAGLGGGLRVYTGSVTLIRNTLIANSPTGGDCRNTGGTLIDGGYNLVEDNTCGFTGGADPMLAGLADNGGATETHALLAGSPAIDAGNPAGCADAAGLWLSYDQRGYLRTVDGDASAGPRCDIGAFEYLSELLLLPWRVFVPLVVH